jgi:alanyl-tRNA synthetase
MTKLLYQLDSYLKEFNGVITRTDPENHALVLDQTVFYPGGGGQPPDSGRLITIFTLLMEMHLYLHLNHPFVEKSIGITAIN